MMVALTALYLFITIGYISLTTRSIRQWLIDPTIVFIFCQLVLFLGSLSFLDFNIHEDVVHCIIMLAALVFFIIGASIVDMAMPTAQKNVRAWLQSPLQRIESSYSFNLMIGIIGIVSIIVGTIYYYAVGYNLLLNAIVSFVRGEDLSALAADMVTMRLESYSGEKYFAPGYANQFKNTLLPLTTIFLIARYQIQKKRKDLFLVLGSVPLSLIFLLGTGQRGFFVQIVVIFLAFVNITLSAKASFRINLIAIVVFFAFFSFTSIFLGRVTKEESTGQPEIAQLIIDLPNRLWSVNQLAAVVGFRYIYHKDIQYGSDWWSHMKILPGQGERITVESEISQIISGSTRGTAPLSIWGQIWYNFGPVGVICISFIMGLIYKWQYVRFLRTRKTLFNILTHVAITILIGTWVAGAPIVLFNNGVVTVMLFKVFVRYGENTCKEIVLRHA